MPSPPSRARAGPRAARARAGRVVAALAPGQARVARRCPGPWIEAELPPRPRRSSATTSARRRRSRRWYRGRLPAHLFPQWGFPLGAARARGAPLPDTCARSTPAAASTSARRSPRASRSWCAPGSSRSTTTGAARSSPARRHRHAQRARGDRSPSCASTSRSAARATRTATARSPRPAHRARRRATRSPFLRISAHARARLRHADRRLQPHPLGAALRARGGLPHACILHGFATLARAIEALNRRRLRRRSVAAPVNRRPLHQPLVLPARVGVYVTRRRQASGSATRPAAAPTSKDASRRRRRS